MIVEIIKDHRAQGVAFPIIGEVYKVKPYPHDSDKLTLLKKLDPETNIQLSEQPFYCQDEGGCLNEYRFNVKILIV